MALGWKNITVARTDCGADVFGLAGFLRDDDLICHDGPLGDVFNAVPLLEHIMNERDMQVKLSGASLGRFGYAPKGMMKRLRCHSNRAPDRRTHRLHRNYRGETPARVSPFQRGHLSQEDSLIFRLAEKRGQNNSGFPSKTSARSHRRAFSLARRQRDRIRQAARMRVLTRRQSSSIACHSSFTLLDFC